MPEINISDIPTFQHTQQLVKQNPAGEEAEQRLLAIRRLFLPVSLDLFPEVVIEPLFVFFVVIFVVMHHEGHSPPSAHITPLLPQPSP
ncbi:MAG: hypothetical protein QG646_216 [Euryarchaeota archaeon]|nr:hypothetical protein [Euryarchaeota archaeon]MDQ1262507.1 hypothetical protein [Euryarchaeota archaeon]